MDIFKPETKKEIALSAAISISLLAAFFLISFSLLSAFL